MPAIQPQHQHIGILEWPAFFKDSVAAFTSWNVFPFILNKKRNAMLQNSGYAALPDDTQKAFNR
jgi:hypothetical protein